jgi:hypothetical protein
MQALENTFFVNNISPALCEVREVCRFVRLAAAGEKLGKTRNRQKT